MYVKDHMTKNPYTITKDTVIAKALEIMDKNHFHRLPVVDADGKLEGLVTGGLVEQTSGANNTSLSIFELNYLLSRTKVSDIMIRDVKTTTQDVFLEEAAQLMIDNEIGVLPVVDADGRVIGIITDKDVSQAFNDLMGYGQRGTRFVINCENVPGYFVGIAKLFAENDANLDSLAVYHSEERGAEVVIKATGEVEVERMMQVLLDGGYNLTDVVQTTADGEMKRYPIHK